MQDSKNRSTYIRRFLFALPAVAALVLTFFFFSPVETVTLNASSFKYSGLKTVIPIMGIFSAVAIVAGTAMLGAFRGKLYDALLAVCLAFALCLYIQGTFMAGMTPPLSGDDVIWSGMKKGMALNTVIWSALFSLPFLSLHFRKTWRYTCILLPAIILVMQLTGLISLLVRPDIEDVETGYLDYSDFCTYSDQGNTLVFMVDRLDYNYIDGVLADDPTFFDRLDGFTSYDNAISQFAHTRPAMNFMLTNYDATLFQEKASDFFEHSWDDGERHILKDLASAGYSSNLYGAIQSLLGKNYASFTPYLSNVKSINSNINIKRFVYRMATLSAYRCFPLTMKPFFQAYSSVYNDVFKTQAEYVIDETIYDRRMSDMSVTSNGKCFKFYEFFGSHPPHSLNADGTRSKEQTDVISQTKGCFEILLRAFDKMKAAGIYKDTAIIILADHGTPYDDYKALETPTRIGLFYKPAGVEGTPLKNTYVPVSLRNIPATIIKTAGLDYSAYGVPLDEVPDDKTIVRDYVRTIADRDIGWKDCWALHYDVAYDAADIDSWTLKSTEKIEYPMGF